jgi:hypothetical protein
VFAAGGSVIGADAVSVIDRSSSVWMPSGSGMCHGQAMTGGVTNLMSTSTQSA